MTNDFLVLCICTAYEQGVGHVIRAELSNPYPECSLEAEAWDLGRQEGQRMVMARYDAEFNRQREHLKVAA